MIRSPSLTCVLDTCVIYPIDIRDLMLWFAHYDLFHPRWSQTILDELRQIMIERGMPADKASKQIQRINTAFPEAIVTDYEELISELELPDQKDRHVLAAAIKVNADMIVTNNLKHFNHTYLARFGLIAKTADDFMASTISMNPSIAKEAFLMMVAQRTSPIVHADQALDIMRNRGLHKSADYLNQLTRSQ